MELNRKDDLEENYELMYFALLDYRFEKISFLEMLDKWEEVLCIKSPSIDLVKEDKNVMDLAS